MFWSRWKNIINPQLRKIVTKIQTDVFQKPNQTYQLHSSEGQTKDLKLWFLSEDD